MSLRRFLNVVDVHYRNMLKYDEEAMESYTQALSEPTPLQKGPYAGLLKARPSTAGSGFMDFMNNS